MCAWQRCFRMSGQDRPSTTRLLALAAILIAAGLFALRAYDLFSDVKSHPAGGPIEQKLTYLLEPITGQDKVRVSVSGIAPKTVLIMMDGDVAEDLRPVRARIEPILVASIGFDPERDALTLSQFPFARGVGTSIQPLHLAELIGLGLLIAMLLASGTLRTPQRRLPAPALEPRPFSPRPSAPSRLAPPEPEPGTALREASEIVEQNPNETARLVRSWMSYAED